MEERPVGLMSWGDLILCLEFFLPSSDCELQAMDEATRDTLIGILSTLHERACAAGNVAEAA
jgi:hypothetical protein